VGRSRISGNGNGDGNCRDRDTGYEIYDDTMFKKEEQGLNQ